MTRPGCAEVERHVFEADPASLASLPGELRRHVDGCPGCRARLERVSERVERLQRGLEESRPSFDAKDAIALARAGRARRPATRRASRWLRWAPVPAALALGLWMAGPPESPRAPDRPDAAEDGPEPAFAVEAEGSGPFAVFETRDPRIRVVWFYDAKPLSHQTGAIDR